jgi:hypothetical protein
LLYSAKLRLVALHSNKTTTLFKPPVMKKTFFTFLAALFIYPHLFSQTCKDVLLKDDGKITLTITTFSNPEKKEDKVTAFNAGVVSGKIKPASNYQMVFTIRKQALKDADEYALTYTVGGVGYSSYLVCKNDTIYSCRNRGPMAVGPADNPIGYTLQGIQTLPLQMKAGDALPSFEDVSFMFPSTTDVTLKKSVFSHYEKQASYNDFGYYTDSQTGERGFGEYSHTPASKAIYKTIDVAAQKTVSVSSHSIQGANALVTGEEDVTINGAKYRAFIIESESWTKPKIDVSYASADADLNKATEEAGKKIERSMEKFAIRRQFTNKLGYTVMFSKQWFVPQLGVVKTESYDTWGGISTIMTTTGME